MTELSRSLLAAAREGLAPDDAAFVRVRAKVAATVAAASATATGAHAAHAAHAAPATAPGLAATLAKLGAVLVVVGVVAAGFVVTTRSRAPDVPQLSVSTGDTDEVRTEIKLAAPDDQLAVPDAASPRAKAPLAPPLAARSVDELVAPPAVRDAPARAQSEPVEPASLSREVELIDLAMVSLRKDAPGAALEAIRVFERETFGRGQMAQEAAAIEIEARCKLREDVTAALERFDLEWPSSAQRERIHTACFAR